MMTDPHVALQRSLEALAFAKSHPDPEQAVHIATAQWLQGVSLVRLNRPDEAEPVIAEGLATAAARVSNSKLHGDLMMARAELQAAKGEVQPALQGFQAAYRVFGLAKQPRSQAMALMHIGTIYQDAGDDPKVLEYYAQAADLFPADLALLITARNNIGRAFKSQKKYAEAVEEFGRAREIARQMHSPRLEASVLTDLAQAEMAWAAWTPPNGIWTRTRGSRRPTPMLARSSPSSGASRPRLSCSGINRRPQPSCWPAPSRASTSRRRPYNSATSTRRRTRPTASSATTGRRAGAPGVASFSGWMTRPGNWPRPPMPPCCRPNSTSPTRRRGSRN